MASAEEENVSKEISGRRTRSGRKVSAPQPAASPARATRRSSKKQAQEQLTEHEEEILNDEPQQQTEEQENDEQNSASHQSDIIKEMLAAAAQGVIIDDEEEGGEVSGDIEATNATVDDNDDEEDDAQVVYEDAEDVIEEMAQEEDDCIVYEEEEPEGADVVEQVVEDDDDDEPEAGAQHHLLEEDVEMYAMHAEEEQADDQDDEEQPLNNSAEEEVPAVAPNNDKSSSFPFGTGTGGGAQSETSEDAQNEEEEEIRNEASSAGAVESSLLASLAGDNANSLPSVGGGTEEKQDFETTAKAIVSDEADETEEQEPPMQPNCEKMDSDSDSMSEPAIAEDLVGAGLDVSQATIVNTEMVSEDELPLPTKPEINDAEEVSDDELPAPQRAELPADAEVISEDELPGTTAGDKKTPASSPQSAGGHTPPLESATATSSSQLRLLNKRKAEDLVTAAAHVEVQEEEKHKKSSSSSSTSSSSSASASKKKKNSGSDEQYNPMSPTSESNEATPPVEKRAKIEGGGGGGGTSSESEHKERKKEKERSKDKEKDKEREKEKERKRLPDLDKYWRAVKEDPADFTGWTYLLQYVDNESDAEAAREAYDAFLSHYPYCYGYWRKYADYEKRKGIKANCNAVFERGLEAIPLSVDLWIHYLSHVRSNHADNEDYIRSQFERAISACGLEFRSDKLWDAYIKWENDSKRYQRVLQIYDRLLGIPTQGYSGHFDNFQDLINQHSIASTITSEELKKIRTDLRESSSSSSRSSSSRSKSRRGSSKDRSDRDKGRERSSDRREDRKEERKDERREERKEERRDDSKRESNHHESDADAAAESTNEGTAATHAADEKMDDISDAAAAERSTTPEPKRPALEDLSDPSTLTEEESSAVKDKVISLRRKVHKSAVAAVTARWAFEEGIKRPYFHVKPLERCQLKNWKDYLDFEIEKGDRKRILVLFERCLIACALYDEFWLKMIRYLETQLAASETASGTTATAADEALHTETANICSDVFRRACQIHHPDKPSLHLMWAAFEECRSNFDRAAEVLHQLEKKCPNLLQIAYRRINVERRRGDLARCRELYEHYIGTAKNKTIAGSLAIKYARFLNKIANDLDGGLRVLRLALEKDAANTRVALQMIDLALQRPKVDEDEVVLIMDKFMARENIDPEQKVLFAQRKVEFLEDFGSTAKGLQDAQRALQLALTKAGDAKKKRESSPSRKSSKDSAAMMSSSAQSAYNNGSAAASAGYNYNSAAYYGQQSGGGAAAYQQQQQQQQQQSYDGYYNHWQYAGGGGGGGGGGGQSGYSGYGQWSGYGNYY